LVAQEHPHNKFEENFLARLLPPGSRVLDFGCGDGCHVGAYITEGQHSYVGVDVSEAAVRACKRKGLDALCYSPDGPLPFQDETFDVVISFEVFEHLFNPQRAVAEILRILRNGGLFVGSVPNVVFMGNRLLMALGYFSPGGSPATSLKRPWVDPHIRFFAEKSLARFLRESGFEAVRILGASFSFTQFPLLYRSSGILKTALQHLSKPVGLLGQWYTSLFSPTLYFVARK